MAKRKANRVRLFVAAELPEDVRDMIGDAIEPLQNEFPGTRWVPPENWHVTVTFLGATDTSKIPWIESQIEDACLGHSPIGLEVAGFEFSAPPRRSPMLWAALQDPDGRLAGLAKEVARSLEPEFPAERRKLRPHVTLARAWNGPPSVDVLLPRMALSVDRLSLFRSDLGGDRPIYTKLLEFSLGH